MEEQPAPKKILHVSPAIQVLIVDTPEAAALLERLKQEQGYEVRDYVDDKTTVEQGIIGHILTETKDYLIAANADALIFLLSEILSSAIKEVAKNSPPLGRVRGFQSGVGEPPKPVKMNGDGNDGKNLLRHSGDSVDLEEDPANSTKVVLRGFSPEAESKSESKSESSAKWCSWFSGCCSSNPERNPLLTPESGRKLTGSK